MEIKGFIQNSLLEWEGRISCVLFLPYCNFRCQYCHASHLIDPELLESIEKEQVLAYMENQKDWLDGAVITGGEPTLHEYELLELVSDIKVIGLEVMIETNGSKPKWVEKLLKHNRIDAIAMDIKAPLSSDFYSKVVGVPVDAQLIRKSAELVIDSGIEHEFRITLVPGLVGKNEVQLIASELQGAQTLALQNFQPDHCLVKEMRKIPPFSEEALNEMADIARPYVEKVIVRGKEHAALAAAQKQK